MSPVNLFIFQLHLLFSLLPCLWWIKIIKGREPYFHCLTGLTWWLRLGAGFSRWQWRRIPLLQTANLATRHINGITFYYTWPTLYDEPITRRCRREQHTRWSNKINRRRGHLHSDASRWVWQNVRSRERRRWPLCLFRSTLTACRVNENWDSVHPWTSWVDLRGSSTALFSIK